MKKQLLLLFIAIFAFGMSVMAHAPKKIILTFDKATNTLKADIQHKVKDVEDHFISDIIIYVNDKEVKTSTYEKQSEKLNEVFEIQLENVKSGDEIKLKAKCNKFGSKSSKIKVE